MVAAAAAMDVAATTPGAVDMVTAAAMDAAQAAGTMVAGRTTVAVDPIAVAVPTAKAGLTVADTAIGN